MDVRSSFASFVPMGVPDRLAAQVIDSAIERLRTRPELHDKVEFAVMPTCYVPSLADASSDSILWQLDPADRREYTRALHRLTHQIIGPQSRIAADLRQCKQPQPLIERSTPKPTIQLAARLLRDVQLEGTPLFARVARAAFIGIALLKSIEAETGRYGLCDRILSTTRSIGGEIAADFARLSPIEFLARHGHIRPGTYDIRVPTYADEPERYFDWQQVADELIPARAPDLPADWLADVDKCLASHSLDLTSETLIEWVRCAVVARELAKYDFCKSLSAALSLIAQCGAAAGLSREQLSYLTLDDLAEWSASPLNVLAARSEVRMQQWHRDAEVRLPGLITSVDQLFSFECGDCTATFVTRGAAEGPAREPGAPDLKGAIVVIESADPGYDWLFTKQIAGFITCYGGENSHMAIRAREFGIAAVIGCGEVQYARWRRAARLRIDCAVSQVDILA